MYSTIIMALKLYSKTGATRLEFSPSSSDKQSERIMGEASISLSFSLPTAIEIQMGDYVDYEGRKYVALANYTPTKKSTREYQYSLSLYTIESTLASVKVLKPASEHQELNFSYDARPHEHIQLIVDNANRAGLGSWRVGTVLSAGSVNIEYNNKYCLEALNDIAEAYNSEWWIENGVINLIKREHGSPIRLAYQEGLTSLYASAAREKPITRLYPLGSTRNIDTSKYGSSRLHLPRNARYIERNTHLGLIEASEEASFSHIYPRYTGVVSSVRTEDRRSPEGKPYKVYYIKDNDIPFNANLHELQGLTKHVVFQSGELNGRDFEANYLTNTKEWEIITQFPYEGAQLPREPLIPKAGDKYIPYNFRMPEEYISRAEEELLTEANKYLDKVSIDNTIYKASTDYTYLLERDINLSLGQRVTLYDVDLFPSTSGIHQTRIIAISRSLLIPQQMEIECSATIERGRIEQMESGLDKMRAAYHRVEATMPSILRSNDSTDPSEDNVLSAVRSIKAIQRTALRKDTDDRTSYSLGSTEHVPGIVGWLLSPEGDLALRNLKISGTLEVDELRKNRISIQEGEHYFSSGNAIVEEVLEGDKMRVKGEQGEVSSLIAGDYVIGKWTNTSGSIEVCKIKITAVNGLLLSYTLAPNTSIRPRGGMHLAQMGHDTDTRRQRASVVRANAIIQYAGVQGWEILPQHITAVMGDLEGFSFEPFGALVGSGVYINNAYITGTITQKSADGHSTRPLPFYKGEWTATSIVHTGDQYLYAGHKWTYQGVTPTTTAPSATANWFDDGEVAESLISNLSIGGRNYIRNSSQEFKMKGLHKFIELSDTLKAGSAVTLSAYIVIHAQPKVEDDKARLKFLLTPATTWNEDNLGLAELPTGVSEGIVQKTITLTRDVTRFYVYPNYSYLNEDKGAEITVKWMKLEYGNKATDYTEAPEDTADAIKKVESESKSLAVSEAGKAQANAITEASRRDTALKTELEGKVSSILSSVATIQVDLQRQIDKQVEMFWGEKPPTGRIGWTEADDAKHEGDTYTVRPPEGVAITPQNAKQYPNVGKSWRWHGKGWLEIADTDVTRALALAGEAKASADGKVTHFRGGVIPTGYKQGDLWTLTGVWNGFKQGSILTATQDEVIGQYNPTHWREELRYTDDTAIRNLAIGGRNLIKNSYKNQERKRGYLMAQEHDLTENWKSGETYTISVCCGIERDKGVLLYIWGGTYQLAEVTNRKNPEDKDGLKWGVYTATFTISDSTINSISDWHKKTYEIFQNGGEGDFILKWVKLERGNKATDYTPAPEEIDANILSAEERAKQYALEGDRTLKTQLEDKMSVNDYLRQAIAKGTKQEAGKIDTGLVLTEVLGVKDRDGLVRSFLSGDTAYPAFAAGVDHFGENNQSSRVMITHDGDVILGQMRMLGDAGVISFVPMAGGTPYLNIGGSPKAINDMVSGQFSGTDRQSEKVVRSYYGEDEIDEIVLIDNFRINKSGTSIRISGSMTVDAQSSRIVDMHNLEVGGLPSRQNSTIKRNGEGYTNIAASIILYYRASETGQYNQVRSWYRTAYSYWDGSYHMGYEEYKSGEQRLDIAESIPGMPQGYYKLALAIKHNGSVEARSNSDVTAQMAMTTESGEREIHLSSQALYAIFGSRRFFHVDENAVTIKHKLDIFGDTNMPGILAAGKVTKWGTIDNIYGAKVKENGRDRARVERQGDNAYKVYHRIGHSNYTVQITPFDTRDAGSILEVASTYFRCCFYGTTDNNRYQHEFCYTCIGNNQ